jgi:hypothetical protein
VGEVSGRLLAGRAVAALCGFAILAILAPLAPALAAEATRGTYKEAVEPICRANTEANERLLAGVRQEVRAGRTGSAAVKFTRAAKALKKTIGELQKVPAPAADAARLSKWLAKVSNEAGYFEAVAKKLRVGDKAGAQKLVVKLTTEANAANNVVLPFEFEYCRLDPARFT